MLFMILQNKTIDAIADIQPETREDFVKIKGLGERKYEKYGKEIIELIHGEKTMFQDSQNDSRCQVSESNLLDTISKKVFSVSQFLDIVNDILRPLKLSVRGELSGLKMYRHLYFSLKDTKNDGKLDALMWESDLRYCGIKPEEGMEVIIHGYLEVYKPSGKATFRAQTMELAGEGALKKAYDELKQKLEKEGLFDVDRKKKLPEFPVRLGVITSRHGAVIHDLLTNLGKYGYKIQLYDTRVEGALANRELMEALDYFRDKDIDLLIVIRGGGSLESLQAFNHEALVRAVGDYPIPIVAGIGHEKDVPLFSMVADAAFSTPTAVAREINKSWDSALSKLGFYETSIINRFVPSLLRAKHIVEKSISQGESFYHRLLRMQHLANRSMDEIISKLNAGYQKRNYSLISAGKELAQHFNQRRTAVQKKLEYLEESLRKNNPENQLKHGYSIAFLEKKPISSIDQIKTNDTLRILLYDGEVYSRIQDISKRSKDGASESD